MMHQLNCPECGHVNTTNVDSFGTRVSQCGKCNKDFKYSIKEIVVDVQPVKVRGEHIAASWTHGAGAYAQCTCGKYTDDHNVFKNLPQCDCGKTQGWSGSFVPPTADSEWSSHYPRPEVRRSIWNPQKQ